MLEYEIEAMEKAKRLSNRELLDTCLNMAGGDDYDGEFTARGYDIFVVYTKVLEDRLADWLKEDN